MALFLPLAALTGFVISQQNVSLPVALFVSALVALGLLQGSRQRRDGHDPLTGLESRDGFMAALTQALDAGADNNGDVAVLLFEAEDLRGVDMRLDRGAFDRTVRQLARRLVGAVRETDTCARIDGPTFAVVATNYKPFSETALDGLSRRLQDCLSRPERNSPGRKGPAISVGFAAVGTGPVPTADELLYCATLALLEGQRAGSGRIAGFDASLKGRIEARTSLAARAARALETGEFEPHFQPQICTETGRLTGFETLARWHCPTRGMISPGEFLPVLQEAGLMPGLGHRMLNGALGALAEWDRAGFDIPQIGVNFSTEELEEPGLVDRVAFSLDRHDLAPHRLSVEILETVVAHATGGVLVDNLRGLAQLGCRLDLDDFGTGHASITTIRNFPIHRLKIDRSFVTHLDTDPEQRRLFGAILTMAERLGLQTLAEGVESMAEQKMLRALGCGFAQGFALGRPMPAADVPGWIAQHLSAPPVELRSA